jgi:ABC-2 type transport system permease protein
MIFSVKRMYAIFQKDLKDLSKNMYVGSMFVLPILLAAIYGRMGDITVDMQYMIINLTFVAVTAFIQCAMIAEEKEKNTLRGLMLSPATLSEILTGKSLVSFITTIITILICSWLLNYNPANLLIIALAIILSTFFYIALGTLFGLVTRSVVEASVVMLPALFIFGMGSLVMVLVDDYPILKVVEYLPNIQIIELARSIEAGTGFGDVWIHLAIITSWFIVTLIATVTVYKKREMDE